MEDWNTLENGGYYSDCQFKKISLNNDLVSKLYDLTLTIVGKY